MNTTTRITFAAAFLLSTLAACTSDSPTAPPPTPRARVAPQGVLRSGWATLDSLSAGEEAELPETPNKNERIVLAERPPVTETTTSGQQITTQNYRVQRVRYSITENPDKFMAFNPAAGALWPGALLRGSGVARNALDGIPVPDSVRRPLTVTLNIVAGTTNVLSQEVPRPSNATMANAMNGLLAAHQGGSAAALSFHVTQIHSESQLNASLSLGYTGPAVKASAQFKVTLAHAKSYVLVSLIQQYFTMSINEPAGPGGFWDTNRFGVESLKRYVSASDPMTYVASVTYGRVYYLLYESTVEASKLEAAIQAAYNAGIGSGDAAAATEAEKTLHTSSVKVWALGGNASDILQTAAKNVDGIKTILVKGAHFSPTHVGAPLSYVVRYVYDNRLVKLANTMEYEVDEKLPVGTPVTSWVQTRFNMTVSAAKPWGYWIFNKGAVQMRLLAIDPDNGRERELWKSPCNKDCHVRDGWKIEDTPWWKDTWTEYLNWDSGTVTVDNRPSQRLVIECKVIDYNVQLRGWVDREPFAVRRVSFKWNATMGKFVLEGSDSVTQCEPHTRGDNMNAIIYFRIFQNDASF
jgi:hypothetical protein